MIKTKTMVSLMLALFIAGFSGISQAQVWKKKISGNGVVIKENRDIRPFTHLEISSAFKVFLKQGSTPSLTVEADENLMERIETRSSGNELKISCRDINNPTKLVLYLTVVDLKMMEISGAVSVIGESQFQFDNIKFDFSGASKLDLDIIANIMNLDVSGASKLIIGGSCNKLNLDASGASKVSALKFAAKEVVADVSGASFVEVAVKNSLNADVSGAAKLQYNGNPSVRQSISGAAKLKQL